MICLAFDDPGEQRRFVALYERYRHLMMKVAYDVLEDRFLAEDAVHNAFIKVSKHMDRIGRTDSAGAKRYLVVITRNAAIDLLRKRRSYAAHEIFMEDLKDADMGVSEQDMGLDAGILDIFRRLPDIYRDVFLLKYSGGLENAEIAEILEISEGTVRQRIARGKLLIEKALKETEAE